MNGSPPYNYSWNTVPAQTTALATGLPQGTYLATIFDANGCDTIISITLTDPPEVIASSSFDSVN